LRSALTTYLITIVSILKYLRNYRDRNLQQGGKKTNITNKYIHKIEKYTQKINELKKY
jgi:hypothetical protein